MRRESLPPSLYIMITLIIKDRWQPLSIQHLSGSNFWIFITQLLLATQMRSLSPSKHKLINCTKLSLGASLFMFLLVIIMLRFNMLSLTAGSNEPPFMLYKDCRQLFGTLPPTIDSTDPLESMNLSHSSRRSLVVTYKSFEGITPKLNKLWFSMVSEWMYQ